ncbi:hypothetical protein BMYO_0576 [Bifidobacterium myosotis]|uniref:Uncharacterized protein n=1 Tax=Bifidobacterium myosotis TaxID=1630166 RepID=A0A261FNL8_9BIFI|nr:hypothetical protein BMYO_0576 [Bifidobacterium myosotis]
MLRFVPFLGIKTGRNVSRCRLKLTFRPVCRSALSALSSYPPSCRGLTPVPTATHRHLSLMPMFRKETEGDTL